jgi:DNA polymerase-3 subunit delta
MSIDALKLDIKKRELRTLYLFYGREEYLKKYYLDAMEQILLKDGFKEFNRVVMEGRVDLRNLADNCETLPMFSEKKLVIVKNSGLFKAGARDAKRGKGKPDQDALLACLQNIPRHICLVFYEEEIDKRLKTVDIFKKNGLIVEFAYLKPAELVNWVSREFKSRGKSIDSRTASFLVDSCEQGMNEILNEINKLALFIGERDRVTGEDVEKVCTKSVKSRIFDLTDAISGKRSTQAMRILNELMVMKEPLPRILFMITRQFRQILEMKLMTEKGLSPGEAASKLGIMPYVAGKVLKQAKSFSVEELKAAMKKCLDLDEAVKTGKMNDRIATEILIAGF